MEASLPDFYLDQKLICWKSQTLKKLEENEIEIKNPSNLPSRPRDITSGYNLSLIQSNVLGHSYGLSSLRDRLKSQKPSGVTDAQIDTNLQHFFDNF